MADSDNRDNWRSKPNSTVRAINENDATVANTADLKKAVSGLVVPQVNDDDTHATEDAAYMRPSVTNTETNANDSVESNADKSDQDFMEYINRTSEENQREQKELLERRETKRLERESAVITVKTPTRSGTFPENRGRDRAADSGRERGERHDRRASDAQGERVQRVAAERERHGRPERTNESTLERRPNRDNQLENRRRDDEYGATDALRWPEIRNFVLVIAVAFLIVLVILVFMLISARRNLSAAENTIETYRTQMNNSGLGMGQPDGRDETIAQLIAENARLNELLDAPQMPGESGNNPATSGSDIEPPPFEPNEQIVVFDGSESLWQIAARTLGNGARFQEILDANGIISDQHLQIGDVLIIPPQ